MTRVLGAAIAMLFAIPAAAQDGPVYVAYYWRAKPGKVAEYHTYIREYAEPIDEQARKDGAFEEVRTYLAPTPQDGKAPEWTHLRVFKVRDAAAADGLGAALDAATSKLRNAEERKAASEKASALRDFVRSERWTELR